jgi:hypothetical protein
MVGLYIRSLICLHGIFFFFFFFFFVFFFFFFVFFFFFLTSSTALVGLGLFFSFLIYSQSVGLLGQVISSSQGLYCDMTPEGRKCA